MAVCDCARSLLLAVCSAHGSICPAMVAHTRMAPLGIGRRHLDFAYSELLPNDSGTQTAAVDALGSGLDRRLNVRGGASSLRDRGNIACPGHNQASIGLSSCSLVVHMGRRQLARAATPGLELC